MTANPIAMRPLASSSVTAYGYDEATGTLAVQYKSGHTYRYEGISPDQAAGFATAKSAGRYAHELLRGRPPAGNDRPASERSTGQRHDVRRRPERPVRTRAGR